MRKFWKQEHFPNYEQLFQDTNILENFLFNTGLKKCALFDTRKLFLPYLATMLKFVLFGTLPSILGTNGVKWHMKRRFYSWCNLWPKHSHENQQLFTVVDCKIVQNLPCEHAKFSYLLNTIISKFNSKLGRTSPVIWYHILLTQFTYT